MKKVLIATLAAHIPLLLLAGDVVSLEAKAKQGDARSAYELAKHYEAQNDTERSMLWYKQAAALSLEPKTQSSKALESSLVQPLQKIERTEAVYGSFIDSYKDDETKSSMKQMVTHTFDIAPYKTNYLLPFTYDAVNHNDGRSHQETKLQISFQKGLFDNLLGLNESIVAAYTHTSWWQTTEHSTPFRETNYQPELFMIMPHFDKDSFIKAYQFGILHESNGRDEPQSRSWNRLYAKAFFQVNGLIISPRIWYRIPEENIDDDNPNIDDYLGSGDIEFIYPWKKHTFKMLVKNNMQSEHNRGAVQFDWTFPLWEDNLFGYIQAYSGYSESLIDYDKRSNRIGVGFALSR